SGSEVEDIGAMLAPISDRGPHQEIVGPHRLELTPTRAPPEVRHASVAREDPGGDRYAFGAARTKKQEAVRRLYPGNELAYELGAVRGRQGLTREDIVQLRVVLLRECRAACLLNDDT